MVVDLPVQYKDRTGVLRQSLLPTLIVRDGSGITIPDEVSTWMLEEVQRTPPKALREMASTIGRLTAFYILSGSPDLETPYDVDCLVDAYLYLRLISPEDISKRPFPLWKRVRPDTVRRELRAIDSLVRSCSRNFGTASKLSEALATSNGVFESRLPKRVHSKLWAHLDSQWELYQTLRRPSPVLSPHLQNLVRNYPRVLIDDGKTMTEEDADAIIECTPNPSYRGLFLAMAGLGRRLCEHLHVFRCDFLTPDLARYFIDYQSVDSLLAFAHPVHSTFTGKFETSWERGDLENRESFLRRYGRVPRNLTSDKNDRCGWKGMVFYHRAYLNIPTWISSEKALLFEETVREMREVVKAAGVERLHPYLFVTCTNAEARGQPMKIGQVERAFERSADKAGLLGKPGIHLHGFRHQYVWHLRHRLKLGRDMIMIAMGHGAVASQDAYGMRLKAIYEAAKAQEGRSNA